jgi:hypothetical protein
MSGVAGAQGAAAAQPAPIAEGNRTAKLIGGIAFPILTFIGGLLLGFDIDKTWGAILIAGGGVSLFVFDYGRGWKGASAIKTGIEWAGSQLWRNLPVVVGIGIGALAAVAAIAATKGGAASGIGSPEWIWGLSLSAGALAGGIYTAVSWRDRLKEKEAERIASVIDPDKARGVTAFGWFEQLPEAVRRQHHETLVTISNDASSWLAADYNFDTLRAKLRATPNFPADQIEPTVHIAMAFKLGYELSTPTVSGRDVRTGRDVELPATLLIPMADLQKAMGIAMTNTPVAAANWPLTLRYNLARALCQSYPVSVVRSTLNAIPSMRDWVPPAADPAMRRQHQARFLADKDADWLAALQQQFTAHYQTVSQAVDAVSDDLQFYSGTAQEWDQRAQNELGMRLGATFPLQDVRTLLQKLTGKDCSEWGPIPAHLQQTIVRVKNGVTMPDSFKNMRDAEGAVQQFRRGLAEAGRQQFIDATTRRTAVRQFQAELLGMLVPRLKLSEADQQRLQEAITAVTTSNSLRSTADWWRAQIDPIVNLQVDAEKSKVRQWLQANKPSAADVEIVGF